MFVMRDGQIRRPQLSDVKQVAERDERIRQLEKQCASLAAEVDKMRPVVEAAIVHLKNPNGLSMEKRDAGLWMAVTTYEAGNPK